MSDEDGLQRQRPLMMLKVVKAAPVLLLLAGASVHAGECLSYAGTVTVKGALSRHTFPEQPNYESIAKGDAAATYFFVYPKSPLCVAEGNNSDGFEPAESRVERVQLVFAGDAKTSYDSLRAYLGKEVLCTGKFFHSISGHHHSPVLLGDAKCSGV